MGAANSCKGVEPALRPLNISIMSHQTCMDGHHTKSDCPIGFLPSVLIPPSLTLFLKQWSMMKGKRELK